MGENIKTLINTAIDEIKGWFLNVYSTDAGFPVYALSGIDGSPADERNLMPEFDDYAPFFYMIGEQDYVMNHVKLIRDLMRVNPLLFNRPQIRRFKGLGLPGLLRRRFRYVDSQDYVEIFYGLLEIYGLSGEKICLDVCRHLFDTVVKAFYRRNTMQSFRLSPRGPTLPVTEAMAGMYIEIAADLHLATKSAEYLKIAEQMAQYWISTSMFQNYHVFASAIIQKPLTLLPVGGSWRCRAELAKPNTSMASGLFRLAQPPFERAYALKALENWVTGLEKHFLIHLSDATAAFAHTASLGHMEHGPILSTNFSAMDILCDLYHLTSNEKYLKLAETIGNTFIDYQSFRTGLFPDNPMEKRSYIDANTDLAVTMYKLTELTGKQEYRDAGEKALRGILLHHRGEYGYYRDVHMESGEIINDIVETRFVSLLLKSLLLYRDEHSIYQDQTQWSKFRDR